MICVNESKPAVSAAKNTLEVLSAFIGGEQEVSLAALTRRLGLHKSTVFRALQTLLVCRYVEQNPESKDYRLSPKVLQLADTFLRHTDLRTTARPHLEELVWKVRQTVTFAIPRQDQVVFIDKVEGPGNVRFFCEIGRSLPLYVGAAARAILAHMPPAEIERYLRQVDPRALTSHTLTSTDELRQALVQTRQQGYSYSNQEVDYGVSAVGAAILDHKEMPVGGIAVAGLSLNFTDEAISRLGPLVQQTALAISRRLGYQA